MKTLKIVVKGNVQGVFFRKFIRDNADKQGVRGFVRNLDNGDVEIIAEGRDEKVNELIGICKKGPPHSKVDELKFSEIKHQGFDRFKILCL